MSDDFKLPKHVVTEECTDDNVEPTVEEMSKDPAPTTAKGLDFIKTMCKTIKLQTKYGDRGEKIKVMKAPKTSWVHNLIHLNGGKFDFTGREYLNPIYNSTAKEILLKTGRQVEKTTFLANNLVILCSLRPYFKALYVSPSHIQTRTFSNDKLKPVIERSPLIRTYLTDNKVSSQVFEKGFTNGSMMFLRSCFLSADRARGISADILTIDEIQDILMSNVPVISQCLSHSKYQYHMHAGTPKTHDNTIEQLWEHTTQCEWMVPCDGCSAETGKKWNFLDMGNIGLLGPICGFCGKDLDVTKGQWQKSQDSRVVGFRIPQLMVPWIAQKGSRAWDTLVRQKETYPESQFYNEVLGLSYDDASKPITRAQLMQCCDSNHHFIEDPMNLTQEDMRLVRSHAWTAGVDWGEGNDGSASVLGKVRNASYTVFTVGGFIKPGTFKVIYAKRYTGKETDPEYVVNDIVAKCTALRVAMIGMDWGHGWGVNNSMFRKFGPQKCAQFMYVDRQKEVRKWDPVGYKFQVMRNHVMSEVFHDLKQTKFVFPAFDEWKGFAKDILNIGVEYVEYQRKMRYIHRPSEPDDFFHSLLLSREVAKIYHGYR